MTRVLLLTQSACQFCAHAKHVLEQVGRDYPLQVAEIDLATERGQRLAAEAGVLFAPGVLLDGEPFAFGRLSERKLRRALAAKIPVDQPRPRCSRSVEPS